MSDVAAPKVSICIPVYNGERFVGRAIESVLAQTLTDLELVISDNRSTDRTLEICQGYAERDPRVRIHRNAENIGILRNFNQLVGIARGEYMRWLGSDDWLEPEYAEACAAALDADPACVAASTFQAHYADDGTRLYEEYRGPRVESERPEERFARMLWFLQHSLLYLDPNFSLFRREMLARTQLHRMMARNDRVLAAELSLVGPWCHVPRCLSKRRRPVESDEEVDEKVRVDDRPEFDPSTWRQFRVMVSVARDARLGPLATARCIQAAVVYYLADVRVVLRRRFRRTLSATARRLGLSRAKLRQLSGRGAGG